MRTIHRHMHPDYDACLIRTSPDEDMSEFVKRAPFITENLSIDQFEGARCWNPGLSGETNGRITYIEPVGLNLLGKRTCQQYSYWKNLHENEICGAKKPIPINVIGSEATSKNSYGNHVVPAGDEPCLNDFGGPLLCDINGKNTLVGIKSRGFEDCVTEGYPTVHISSNAIYDWLKNTITEEDYEIWSNWSRCTDQCTQTRTRGKHENIERKCHEVCHEDAIDEIDPDLKLCQLERNGVKDSMHHRKGPNTTVLPELCWN